MKDTDAKKWFDQGISCVERGDYSDAVDCFRRTLTLAPESLEALLNLGYVLDLLGRPDDALHCYDLVLKVSPTNAKARYNRASHLLRSGDLLNGFTDYEFRFAAIHEADGRNYSQPRWNGSAIHGRSILVYCEQGLGDALMFARYIPLLARMGARVTLEVQQPLVSLLSGLEGVELVIVKTNVPPLTDFHVPLLSLPHIFQTSLDTIPNHTPYLSPVDTLVSTWKERVENNTDNVRVGLVWAGKLHPYPNRSCPPEHLEQLLSLPGFQFYSLQVGEQDRFPLSQMFLERIIDLTDIIRDFADTAALIVNLDLVITIDTAVAHLAGALGKHVWVLLPHTSDWRWMLERADSPWYPSMRLFRQPQAGDWASVIDEVAQKLKETFTESATRFEINPESEENQFQSALQSLAEGKYNSAINQLSALLTHIPDDPALLFNMGRAYDMSEQLAKATEFYLKAIQLKPDSPDILFCLGKICLKHKAFSEAKAYLRKAHEQMPQSIEILLAMGGALVQLDDTIGAFECCHKMLAINPECVEAKYNLAYLQLRSGDYLAGFANFEVRLANKKYKIDLRCYPQPHWDGSPLEGKSILVFGEQGMGDVIQFARYLPLVAERGGKVILEVDPPLIPLFQSFPSIAQVLPKSATPPVTDVYIHLLSLPHLFGTTLATVPNQIPYIVPDATKVAEWQNILAGERTYRVGLVWRGSPNNPVDSERSCPLAMFSPLAALSGARFFSLQVGAGTEEIHSASMDLLDHTARLKDMSDTAAFIANLDLIIGVDTAVTHLAGAMGKPVWVILPHVYDWRWLIGRDESPWYPTARLFWQEGQGDWARTITRVRDALAEWLERVKEGGHRGDDIETLYNLGSRLKEEGDLDGAERCFRQIVDHDPSLPDPQHSLGVILHLQGRPQETIKYYRAALNLDPSFVKTHYNLANSLLLCGCYKDAIVSARATIQYDPTHADAHWLLGMLLLQQGDFRNGWQEYNWRWKAQNFKVKIPDLGRPQWDGSSLEGKTLLIHMEQGRGDMIQFIRYASIVATIGGDIIVSAVPELVSLLESVEGVNQVVSQAGPLPDFDLHVPVLSLPCLLGTTLETIPCKVPYLWANREKIEDWQQILPLDGRFRIGLVWQGSPIHRDDRNRSCTLSDFLPLGQFSGVDFYSLQLDKGKEQLLDFPDTMKVVDLSGRINDFSDTAAIVMNLDLVISVDTAVAHLAGALGKPVWTLLPFIPDWRWLLEREDSPWYPTMRLFRQKSSGNWPEVISRVRKEISQLLAGPVHIDQSGIDLMNMGYIEEAERAFAAEIDSNPDNAKAYCNRGVALDAMQRYEEAINCYRIAISQNPNYIQPLFNMGNACMSLGNSDGACACYERVLQLAPDFVPAHLCLGEIAKARREYELAHSYYKKALSVDPNCTDTFQGIAETFQAEEKFEDAIIAYQQVLTHESGRADSWNKLGMVYHSLERHEEAEASYRQALALLPDCVTILNNLGVELNDQGRLDEAISVYRHLLEVDYGYADGHWNLSVALLSAGKYLEGWREYEWRFKKTNPVKMRHFTQPCWDGSPLAGKTILLHAEQGFGDTIQFARYVPMVAERGGKVVIESQVSALKRLLHSLKVDAEVVVAGEPLPTFDCHLPMMSLPLLFGTTLETVPSHIPYLAAEPADVKVWQQRLGAATAFRVGLVWFAKQSQVLNRKRSCRLEMFAPLWSVPGVEFYTLQIGLGAEQLAEFGAAFPLKDLTGHITDFADTAGFIANLDLVITIDTAVAHLAGALGARTWLMLPYVSEWRWLSQRQDSPWYPTMQLFRQPCAGDWPALIASVTEALNCCVHTQSRPISKASFHSKLRVGLAWSCRQDNPLTLNRICPIEAFAPLFGVPDVAFFRLQPREYIDNTDNSLPLIDLTDHIRDFEDTAALMASLDLVISVDTSVAHLAAASGCPTWVILPHVAEWRWLQSRDDSPWYPGVLRLFRQPDFGDWSSVIDNVAAQLSLQSGKYSNDKILKRTQHHNSVISSNRLSLEQSLEHYNQAVINDGSCPDAHLNVGTSLSLLGKFHEAAASFRKVIVLDPGHVTGHINLAYSLLALGEYSEGWQHFEWRLRRIPAGQIPPLPFLSPEQLGSHPVGTSVLVHCEQGYGDTIMFCRFLPLLADAGYRIIISCQPSLATLMASVSGVKEVILHGELLPRCDYQVLLLSLPYLLSATLKTLPANIPYMFAREQLKIKWEDRVEIRLL